MLGLRGLGLLASLGFGLEILVLVLVLDLRGLCLDLGLWLLVLWLFHFLLEIIAILILLPVLLDTHILATVPHRYLLPCALLNFGLPLLVLGRSLQQLVDLSLGDLASSHRYLNNTIAVCRPKE